MMKSIISKIAQKNLEEKVNKKKNKINQSTKNYLEETEKYLGCEPKLADYLDEMDKDEEINKMKPKQLSTFINKVKEEAEEITYKNEVEFLKEDKFTLKNKIYQYFPKIDKKMSLLNKKNIKEKVINIKDDPILIRKLIINQQK